MVYYLKRFLKVCDYPSLLTSADQIAIAFYTYKVRDDTCFSTFASLISIVYYAEGGHKVIRYNCY